MGRKSRSTIVLRNLEQEIPISQAETYDGRDDQMTENEDEVDQAEDLQIPDDDNVTLPKSSDKNTIHIICPDGSKREMKGRLKVSDVYGLPAGEKVVVPYDMRWHEESRVKDGLLRHPADGEAWKAFDAQYPDFASEVRNVRLGLSSDGFNPFRTMNSEYSVWPVVLVPYNLPPWIGMKQSSFILSMIIPGKRSPGNDIDVFLQPLVEELNQLWRGVETYDGSKQENFIMRAALMWTVSDFPAYAMLSGWSTKGRFACPNCADKTDFLWLSNGRKLCYMGHRRWLPEIHSFREPTKEFDNTEDHRPAPTCPTGESILEKLENLTFTFGKKDKERKARNRKHPATTATNRMQRLRVSTGKRQQRAKKGKQHMPKATTKKRMRVGKRNPRQKRPAKEPKETDPMKWWKKKSIFFNLPYWKHNLLRHNLDVMHIEKNVCDMLVGLLLNTKKCKDNLNARRDLEKMDIKHELHPKPLPNGKFLLPAALFTMDKSEKKTFCEVIRDIKTPDGYASDISRCVNMEELKLTGLKSHDCHVLIEEILPLALQSCSPSNQVLSIVIELATFFKALCSKVINVAELDKMQEMLVQTLCKMETYFLPSFFTVMVHLTVHLISEVKLGGPVHYRWMYPFERYFVRLKSYVRNRACPEGSIAEGYVADECLTFCSRYLEGVNTRFNRPKRNPIPSEEKQDLYLFESAGETIGKVHNIVLDNKSLIQAQRYVLRHCDDIENFRKEFIDLEKQKNNRLTEVESNKLIDKKFGQWFQNKVMQLPKDNVSERIWALARGPNEFTKRFSGYIINGWRFHTKKREIGKRSQNSGVVNASEVGDVHYYGKINDMLEIDYYGDFKVVLFKCDWVNVHHKKGMKHDIFGHNFVNFNHLIATGAKVSDDPFVFASQVEQVFYVTDPTNSNWSLAVRTKPRDYFNMGTHLDATLPTHPADHLSSEMGEPLCLVRTDIDGREVEEEIDPNKKN